MLSLQLEHYWLSSTGIRIRTEPSESSECNSKCNIMNHNDISCNWNPEPSRTHSQSSSVCPIHWWTSPDGFPLSATVHEPRTKDGGHVGACWSDGWYGSFMKLEAIVVFKWISEECTRPCFVQPKKYVNSTSTSETFLQIPVIVLAGSNGICPFNQKLSRDLLDLFNELQSILRILVSEQLPCSFPKIMYRYGMIWHTVVLSSWRFAESQQHVLLWKPVINPADEKDMQRWIFPSYPWDPCCDGFPLGATALTSWYVVSVGESCWVHYLAHIRSWHSLGHDFWYILMSRSSAQPSWPHCLTAPRCLGTYCI